jgi:hypothetical protein
MKLRAGLLASLLAVPVAGQPSKQVDLLLDHIVEREKKFLETIQTRTPIVETYIQETPESGGGDSRPNKDHYFLGRFRLGEALSYEPLVERTDPPPQRTPSRFLFRSPPKNQPRIFVPRGFAQMAVIDLRDFNRQTYSFEYARREFLGEVRCLVFDVAPLRRQQPGKFVGRIWIEERDDSIVRFNGTYIQAPASKGTPPELYFHFDSWRVNVGPAQWAPAQIYIEEEGGVTPRFKAQTRIWDYAATPTSKLDELTSILVENQSGVKDQTGSQDVSPLESQRLWEHQAEENILTRLEKGGLLAPPGPVDEVLNTVVSNLIASSGLNVEARCRVLLTTPMETFSIGRTIVVSRGLIDVLPDETSLALVLAGELSHIALVHRPQTQFAFYNQTMVSDAELLQRFRFERSPQEMLAAAKNTVELMRASPYQKVANAGLFLKALSSRGSALPRLLQANLGNQVANAEALGRLSEFSAAAPVLEEDKLDQIAALPLGSRVKLDPWTNRISLVKTRPISLLSAREKMPFEVTPFVLYLTRVD